MICYLDQPIAIVIAIVHIKMIILIVFVNFHMRRQNSEKALPHIRWIRDEGHFSHPVQQYSIQCRPLMYQRPRCPGSSRMRQKTCRSTNSPQIPYRSGTSWFDHLGGPNAVISPFPIPKVEPRISWQMRRRRISWDVPSSDCVNGY